MSDEDRSINVLSRKDSLKSSPSKSSLNLETEKKISTATLRNATDNRTVAEEHPVQKTTKRRTNIDGSPKAISKWKPVRKREKKERKTPQRHCNRSTDTEDTQPSSQLLEPPKFSTAPSETTDKDRRFCLFEDEWIKPKSPAKKKKDRQRKSKSPKEESNKEPIFSWSPALGCSQYTPKVKKATEGLFPAENEAYHYRVDRQRQSNVSAKQRDLSEKYHEKKCKKQKRSSGIKNMCQVMTGSSCPKRKENGLRRAKCPVPEKTQKRQVDSHKARSERISFLELPSADIHECEDYENQTKHSSLPQTKTFKMKQRSIHRTEDDENRRELRQRKSLRSESNPIFDEPKTTASASANAEDRSGGVSENRPRMSKRKNKMDKLDKQSPICTENSLVPDGEAKYVRPVREKQVSHEKPEIDISASPPSDFSPIKRKSFTGDYTPSHSQGADLLRRILFQLKNTVTSSQSAAQVSPTQSRITEVSGMSVKSLSSNGPSPSSLRDVRDLMDDLEPLEEAPKKKTLTTVNSGTAYRKRGNILCNMFDEFDSENGPPAKTKRFLPSQSRLTESDFDILFSADIFV
ncbi:uncharacterized protein LOC143284150 [Babylonia areolata]|uniref:uncharacterized protein LOC143284150 n=1 Tax=Babylonia areolata TaxID=304850 RepID=UPI003FD1790B